MRLDKYPVDYQDPAVRAVIAILAESFFRVPDIVRVLQESGLPPHEVDIEGSSAMVWRRVFDLAAGRAQVHALLSTVKTDKPALGPRIDELTAATGPTVDPEPSGALPDYASSGWKNFSEDGVREAVIVAGQPTFVDISFMEVGLARARAVCRLATRFPGEGSGTAFRVGTRQLLTNHHVLFNHDDGDRRVTAVSAWFDYETAPDGKPRAVTRIACLPDTIVGEKDEDWAIIETETDIPDRYPILGLETAGLPEVDDRVYIIQHPYGMPKKVAFQHNLVRAVMEDRFQYWTDTDVGSSGSPVFNEQWEVVGLHHFSVPAPEEDRISVRNQGRLIHRVRDRMRVLEVSPGV